MTKADNFRAMTDEELAELLRLFCKGMEDCEDCPFFSESCPMSVTFNDWIKWLKQPVDAPKVDAVEVVRCRECEHGKRGVDNIVQCEHPSGKRITMTAYGFCSYGLRRAEK